MSIKLSDSIRVGQQKPLEDKYFNELVPYTSTSQVNTLLPKAVRHIGLTVNINKEEYWYKDGIEDSNLVLKITNSDIYDLKNQEQDDRLENLEGENASQNDLINDLFSELQSEKTRNDIQDSTLNNLEGIYYTWSPTNRTLTLFNREGTQLSQVSLVSLDNEGTDLKYNPTTLSLELYNGDNELLDSIPVSSFIGSVGTQLQLNSNQLQLKDSQGNILSTVTFEVSNIGGLLAELAKKINTGVDTVFNFKNISAMTLNKFRSITPNIETIYFTEEQNGSGWQQIRYSGLGITIPAATTETKISITNEEFTEIDSDSTFNLIDVANTKINGIFDKDFVIIKFNAGVVTPTTANQWFKIILKINDVQTAVSPVFYLTETSGTVEQIAHNFALNVTPEMITNGATLHLKTSVAMTFNNPAISVVRVHKSTNANL